MKLNHKLIKGGKREHEPRKKNEHENLIIGKKDNIRIENARIVQMRTRILKQNHEMELHKIIEEQKMKNSVRRNEIDRKRIKKKETESKK
jgi:hypothetical protein